MNYRERFLNTLDGKPVDQLPCIEWGLYSFCFGYSKWGRHIAEGTDPREYFGFDNAKVDRGYEAVPIDWFALPRFEEKTLPSPEGYLRRIDPLFGEVVKEIPPDPRRPMEVRVFEEHPVKTRDDWLGLRERFQLSTDGRFPQQWAQWCEHSRIADHPIGLVLRGPSKAAHAAIGLGGQEGLFFSVHDRPDFLKEILRHFAELTLLCAETLFLR